MFFCVFAIGGLAMATTLYEPVFAVTAAWFDRHRPRAVFVLTVFGGLASAVFVPLTAGLVTWLGWRDALLMLAGDRRPDRAAGTRLCWCGAGRRTLACTLTARRNRRAPTPATPSAAPQMCCAAGRSGGSRCAW